MPVTIKSEFKPMTYDEIAKPLIAATEEQNLLEEAYVEKSTEAAKILAQANQQTDPRAYSQLKSYADALQTQAESLAKNGLSASSRLALLDLKRKYGTEIVPIEQAAAKRQTLIKEQQDALLNDNTLRYDTDFKNVSLDWLIANPNSTYTPISGANIAKVTGDMASNFAKQYLSGPEISSLMGTQYFQVREQKGYSIQDILKEAINDPNAPVEVAPLRNLRQVIYGQFKNNPAFDEQWAKPFVDQGIMNAIGEANSQFKENGEYLNAATRESLQLQSEFYDPRQPEAYTPLEGYPGYVVSKKNGKVYNTTTGAIAGSSIEDFRKYATQTAEAAKRQQAIKLAKEQLKNNPIYYDKEGSEVNPGKIFGKYDEGTSEEVAARNVPSKLAQAAKMYCYKHGIPPEQVGFRKSGKVYKLVPLKELDFGGK